MSAKKIFKNEKLSFTKFKTEKGFILTNKKEMQYQA